MIANDVGGEVEEYHLGLLNSSSSDRLTAGYRQLLMEPICCRCPVCPFYHLSVYQGIKKTFLSTGKV